MTATAPDVWRYPYTPTPKQREAHAAYADEMLYGGSAGGGKSEWLLATAVTMCLLVPGFRAILFRRTFPDLNRSLIPRLNDRIPTSVATYNIADRLWTFRNGSTLELGYMDSDQDAKNYQGAEYQLVGFDELTQFTEYQYLYLVGRVRAAGPVAAHLERLGLRPRVIASANPGGRGHHWVKARFIDPAPANKVWRPPATTDDPTPMTRLYCPARLSDNPYLDAGYASRLSPDPMLRRALLEGDWDILEGVRFTGWRRGIHVIEPEDLPIPLGGGVVRGVGVDYGLDAPFSAHWGAKFGDGLVVVYRELYEPGLTPAEQAAAIHDAEAEGERGPTRPIPIALDPSTWARNPHQLIPSALDDPNEPPPGSIAAEYRKVFGSDVVKARNDRLAGAALVDDKLRVRADKMPRILVYSTCTNLIRTLPALPRSSRNPEDVDTTAEDHAYDSLRYLLMDLEGRADVRPDAAAGGGAPRRPRPSGPAASTAGLGSMGF